MPENQERFFLRRARLCAKQARHFAPRLNFPLGAVFVSKRLRAAQANFVTPGLATAGIGSGPNSYFWGFSSSLECRAMSQVMTLPVYVAMRPMIAMRLLWAIQSPLLSGRPARIDANSSS